MEINQYLSISSCQETIHNKIKSLNNNAPTDIPESPKTIL